MTIVSGCNLCSGTGRYGFEPCRECNGAGIVEEDERYCSEGCGRVLLPHEDGWCEVCGGGTDAEDRDAPGYFGAFVLPEA